MMDKVEQISQHPLMHKLRNKAVADVGPLVLRVVAGSIFIYHGLPKLQMTEKTVAFFTKIGIPMPEFFAPFVGGWEVVGGALLILGLVTRFWALGLVVNMTVAILCAKGIGNFKSYELELSLGAMSLALFLMGAGRYSLDARLMKMMGMKKSMPATPPSGTSMANKM